MRGITYSGLERCRSSSAEKATRLARNHHWTPRSSPANLQLRSAKVAKRVLQAEFRGRRQSTSANLLTARNSCREGNGTRPWIRWVRFPSGGGGRSHREASPAQRLTVNREWRSDTRQVQTGPAIP